MFPNFLLAFLLLCSPLSTSTQEVFAYYKLALQWPISFCNVRRSCSKVISSGQEFTVHGLWPFWANHTMLKPCPNSGIKLTKNQVSAIHDELKEYWPSFKGKDFDFWYEQWEKHGRCLGKTSFQYFKYTVDLAKHYRNCLRTLNKQGHTAKTKSYKMTELHTYFQQAVKPKSSPEPRKIQFKCNTRNEGFQLLEFYICISRKEEVLDCPPPRFINCGHNNAAEIWYPNEKTLLCRHYGDGYAEL